MTELEHKRKLRRKSTAEDFTPIPLVEEMLSKLPPDVWLDPSKSFIDPAAGNGNFLIEVLRRKLSNGHPPLQALSTIFAVELMEDNTEEMKERLLELIPNELQKEGREIVDKNIICHDALKWDFINWKSLDKKSIQLF